MAYNFFVANLIRCVQRLHRILSVLNWNFIIFWCNSDPICVLSCARDHARETLRTHAAQERLVSHQSNYCPLLTFRNTWQDAHAYSLSRPPSPYTTRTYTTHIYQFPSSSPWASAQLYWRKGLSAGVQSWLDLPAIMNKQTNERRFI